MSTISYMLLLAAGQAAARQLSVATEASNGDSPVIPQRTVMQCLGTETLTRACHFENVYYDLSTSRFIHYGVAGAMADAFGEVKDPEEPWLRLIRGGSKWLPGASEATRQFYLDFRPGDPLPAPEEVATYTKPLHLRSPYHTKSLGHLLRDNLQYLVELPVRFGRDPIDFDWVRWESEMPFGHWEEESETAVHYRALFNNRASVTWQQVLDTALKGKDRKGVKYIQFSEIIAGQGPADMASQVLSLDFEADENRTFAWAHMCDPFAFSEMRRVAYNNCGLEVASVHDLEPFVLFLGGQPDERRHLVNAEEIIPSLKKTFPGVRIEYTQISRHPVEEQMELLSKATVLVSNIGSRSFRLIYLPNGASTILVGPPEYTFDLEPLPPSANGQNFRHATVDTVTPFRIERPFVEIDWCWGYLGYVNVLRYHVQNVAEVHAPGPWHMWTEARNADIILDESKITQLVRVALERTKRSAAYTGSGALSAYNA